MHDEHPAEQEMQALLGFKYVPGKQAVQAVALVGMHRAQLPPHSMHV